MRKGVADLHFLAVRWDTLRGSSCPQIRSQEPADLSPQLQLDARSPTASSATRQAATQGCKGT